MNTIQYTRQLFLGSLAIAALSLGMLGCSDSEADQSTLIGVESTKGALEVSTSTALVDKLAERVELTDQERSSLQAAAEQLRSVLSNGPGNRGELRAAMNTFILGAAKDLDAAEMVVLFEVMGELREEHRAQMSENRSGKRAGRRGSRGDANGQGHRRGPNGPQNIGDADARAERLQKRLEFLDELLELSDEQLAQLTVILENLHAEMFALIESREPGVARAEFHAQRQEARDKAHALMAEVFSAEQLAVFDGLATLHPQGRR
jgi:hypothetical protein